MIFTKLLKSPRWFPKSLQEVKLLDRTYVDFTETLGAEYPGADDPEYFTWLKQVRTSCISPDLTSRDVQYSADCQVTWQIIYNRLRNLHFTYACDEHSQNLRELEALGIYSPYRIPQFSAINEYLASKTGFRLVPVGGMLNNRSFLNALAYRVFFCTQYLRHKSVPFYSPEPDVVHELMGHVPLFANPDFAQFSQEIGIRSLGASDEEIAKLAKLYFYAVEFGVVKSGDKVTVLGAGILGSCEETDFIGTGQGNVRPWETQHVIRAEYELSKFQPIYFACDSLMDFKIRLMSSLEEVPRHVIFNNTSMTASSIY